ncbi:MAG: hypothetical protein ABI240_16770 [Sphingomonas sp.]
MCLPFTNSIWVLTDEGIWLHAARRMSDGQILYRDFFEFHPPLGFLIVYGWVSAFGSSLLAARLLVVLVIASTAGFAFAACRAISDRVGLSAFLALFWVVVSQGYWTQVNHHWLTSLFSMIALWALMPAGGKPHRPALAGLAASAAVLVTTQRGGLIVLASLVAVLRRRSAKALMWFTLGGAIPLAAALTFLWWQGAMGAAFEQVILYSAGHYSNIQWVPFGAFIHVQTAAAVAVFPVSACLLVLGIRRHGFALLRRRHWITAILFSLSAFLGCFPRPDAMHIAFGAVLALPLLAALVDLLLPQGRIGLVLQRVAIAFMLATLVPLFGSAIEVVCARHVESGAGMVSIVPRNGTTEILDRLNQIPPGDSVFFYPYDPLLAVLAGRRHPARLDLLVPQYSTASQYFETCRDVMKGAQWAVIDIAISKPSFYHGVFPAMGDPSPPEKMAFEAALYKGFADAGRFGDFHLLRRANATSGLCDEIPGVAR